MTDTLDTGLSNMDLSASASRVIPKGGMLYGEYLHVSKLDKFIFHLAQYLYTCLPLNLYFNCIFISYSANHLLFDKLIIYFRVMRCYLFVFPFCFVIFVFLAHF